MALEKEHVFAGVSLHRARPWNLHPWHRPISFAVRRAEAAPKKGPETFAKKQVSGRRKVGTQGWLQSIGCHDHAGQHAVVFPTRAWKLDKLSTIEPLSTNSYLHHRFASRPGFLRQRRGLPRRAQAVGFVRSRPAMGCTSSVPAVDSRSASRCMSRWRGAGIGNNILLLGIKEQDHTGTKRMRLYCSKFSVIRVFRERVSCMFVYVP